MKKVFTNVRLTDDDELHDIWVENGRIDKIVPAGRMSFSKNGCPKAHPAANSDFAAPHTSPKTPCGARHPIRCRLTGGRMLRCG